MPQQTVSGNRGDDQLQRRLHQLTGSDEVRLNDRDYMNLLHDRLEEEYYKQQSGREKKLREEEIRRVRRLKREGVIDDAQYLAEMTHIQRHGVGTERFGAPPPVHESPSALTFPLLTDGNVEFHDNPEAITYRGYLEDPNSADDHSHAHKDQHEHHHAANKNQNDSTKQEGEENSETGENGEKALMKEESQSVSNSNRPQSVTVQQLNDVDTIANMYEMAKSMVFVEVGLNPPRRGKAAK